MGGGSEGVVGGTPGSCGGRSRADFTFFLLACHDFSRPYRRVEHAISKDNLSVDENMVDSIGKTPWLLVRGHGCVVSIRVDPPQYGIATPSTILKIMQSTS